MTTDPCPPGAYHFAADDPVYEVFAIRYARTERRRADSFLGAGADDRVFEMAYYVWLVRNAERVILVDTGFDAEVAAYRGRELLVPVDEGIRQVGSDPGTIADVVFTHLHHDHAGNHHLFAAARFHVTAAEMAYVTGPPMTHPWLRAGYGAADVKMMVDRLFQDRLVFHDGRSEIVPGVIMEPMPGHTAGIAAVLVNTAGGTLVLASDSAVFYEGLMEGRAFPPAFCGGDELAGYARLKRLAGDPDRIVPGHDAAVMTRYPAAVPGLAWRVDGPQLGG